MYFEKIKTPGLAHYSYILADSEKSAIVIDPKRDIDSYLKSSRKNGLSIQYVFETHRQEDFILGSTELAKLTGAKIVHAKSPSFQYGDIQLKDGEKIELKKMSIVGYHTPGHTEESMCYAVFLSGMDDHAWGVFTGDALFSGSTGRTDLIDSKKTAKNALSLYKSLHEKILPLGDQTFIFPAHGSGSACGSGISNRDDSTLGLERLSNPVFQMREMDFVKHKIAENLEKPPYFQKMRRINTTGFKAISVKQKSPLIFQPETFRAESRKGIILDTRLPEAFSAAHIPHSLNIWLEGVPTIAGWALKENTNVYLVTERVCDLESVILSLARIGIDQIEGTLADGFPAWRSSGFPTESFSTTSPREAIREWQESKSVFIDVRKRSEWKKAHIPGSFQIFAGELDQKISITPSIISKKKDIIVTCGVGNQTSFALSVLKRNGYHRVSNLLGGMQSWKKLNFPVGTIEKEKKAA
jgi:hydroxyacylglutathione hydrolase